MPSDHELRKHLLEDLEEKGFPSKDWEPVFHYYDSERVIPSVVEGVLQLRTDSSKKWRFEADWELPDEVPCLPFLLKGELWHEGWDIPTLWAIDSYKTCWINDAHGGYLRQISTTSFLCSFEHREGYENLYKALGKEAPQPEWMRLALANGWTPPQSETVK